MATVGFGGRLTRDFPSQVIIDITEVCNLACIHCPHPAFKKSVHYGARYLDPDLNKKAVDESKGETGYIRYTSEGEPLIHPRSYDMIQYAVESGTFTTLTTNGTLLNRKRMRKLLDTGLQMIDVSIDAFTNDTYKIVRKGDLDITRKNVLDILSIADKTKIVVSFVEQPENTHEVDEFREFWTEQGAEVVIRRLHSAAGAVKSIADKMDISDRYPCVYPWERIVLTPRGLLSFCPADWTDSSRVVDYRTTTIQETWNSGFYQKLREAHLCNKFGNHSFCGNCPDWKQTRWPGQGRSYADLVDESRDHTI